MNSKLHQQEHILKTRFTCDLCSDIFTSEKKLCVHLDSHDLLEIGEALDFPANEVSTLIKSELATRHVTDWIATLPSILWSMRTARSETRGASPYEIIFGFDVWPENCAIAVFKCTPVQNGQSQAR